LQNARPAGWEEEGLFKAKAVNEVDAEREDYAGTYRETRNA
jgi:hypothetical protein